jgi:hypothetical protein
MMTNNSTSQTLSERDLQPSENISADAATASDFTADATNVVVNIEQYRKARRTRETIRETPDWPGSVIVSVCEFLDLPNGWDTYKGQPLRPETGMFALKILNDVMHTRVPIPQLFPTAQGGIQIEWHQNDLDVELHVAAPYECELWYRIRSTDEEGSAPLTTDFSLLSEWVAKLRRPQAIAG